VARAVKRNLSKIASTYVYYERMNQEPLSIDVDLLAEQLDELIFLARRQRLALQIRHDLSGRSFEVLLSPSYGLKECCFYRDGDVVGGDVSDALSRIISGAVEASEQSTVEISYDAQEIAAFIAEVASDVRYMLSFKADFTSLRDPVFQIWIGGKAGTSCSNDASAAIAQARENASVMSRNGYPSLREKVENGDWQLYGQQDWMTRR
jgi:hypothetical protein